MTSPSDSAETPWSAWLDTLEGVLRELAPLNALFDGYQTSAAEHGRSALLAAARERIRLECEARHEKATEARLDDLARADAAYLRMLGEHVDMKQRRAELDARRVMLEHRLAFERAILYRDSTLARSFGG